LKIGFVSETRKCNPRRRSREIESMKNAHLTRKCTGERMKKRKVSSNEMKGLGQGFEIYDYAFEQRGGQV
jgi:hypothetical protein